MNYNETGLFSRELREREVVEFFQDLNLKKVESLGESKQSPAFVDTFCSVIFCSFHGMAPSINCSFSGTESLKRTL